jgi:hypothetical protein
MRGLLCQIHNTMKFSNKAFIWILIVLGWQIPDFGYGQLIQGTVQDGTTRKRVPFASIYCSYTQGGTLSNENGDFDIRVSSFPVQLVVSHLSYQTDTITISESSSSYSIQLKPAVHELAAVTVSNAGYKLIQQAFDRVKADKHIIYGKSFYRQLTMNGKQPTELQEVFYKVKLSASQIEGVQIENARYAKLPFDDRTIYFTFVNFSYLVLGQKAISQSKPNAGTVLYPVRPDVADYYFVSVNETIVQPNGDKIAEVECRIHDDYPNAAFTGKVYINMTTRSLVKMQGKIHHSMGAAINTSKTMTDNHVYNVDVDYVSRHNTTVFSSIRVNVDFDQLVKSTGEKRKDQVGAFLFIDDFSTTAVKAKFKPVAIDRVDLTLIRRSKYDPEFWRTNPAVRRTPLEETTIKAFEQEGVMGNMRFDSN